MVALLIVLALRTPWAQSVTPAVTHVTLAEAIQAAQKNEVTFAAAAANQKVAGIDSYLAKVALLPTVKYHNQAFYT